MGSNPIKALKDATPFEMYKVFGRDPIFLPRCRINVAISRAKCLAVVVGDPRIANSPAGSIDEMKLLNLYCKLKSQSSGQT